MVTMVEGRRPAGAWAIFSLHELLHLVSRTVDVPLQLALPDPKDRPTRTRELGVVPSIPLVVRRELLSPELGIGPAKVGWSMFRAAVPVATVHEDRHARSRKYQIRPAKPQDTLVHAVAHAAVMNKAS